MDYRAFFRITKQNSTATLRLDEMFERLEKAIVFSKMVLRTRLYQIGMHPEDIEKLLLQQSMVNLNIKLWKWAFTVHLPHFKL